MHLMKKVIILSTVLIMLNLAGAFSHGLEIEVVMKYPAVISSTIYSANDPAKKILVSIFSPSDKTNPYQTGQTDPAGNFAFIPDAEGIWTIVADDGKGHREEAEVTVSAGFLNPQEPVETELSAPEVAPTAPETQGIPKIYKILMGLSVIFGLTGIYYGFKVKQSIK